MYIFFYKLQIIFLIKTEFIHVTHYKEFSK